MTITVEILKTFLTPCKSLSDIGFLKNVVFLDQVQKNVLLPRRQKPGWTKRKPNKEKTENKLSKGEQVKIAKGEVKDEKEIIEKKGMKR